ncbi:MAG: hypothetical protein SNJ78_04705 [Spirochaetales bacterium]
MSHLQIERLPILLSPSPRRVLIRPFIPHDEQRRYKIIAQIMSLSEETVRSILETVFQEFKHRHKDIIHTLFTHYEHVKQYILTDIPLTEERKLLIVAYFTQEYALESAALFNPSIVLLPDQADLAPGTIRFILSLRAIGERSHISYCIPGRCSIS